MDFAVVGVFRPTEEHVPIARAADELGYAALAIADHVVDLETIETPCPLRGGRDADAGSTTRSGRTGGCWSARCRR